ncbi:MAG: hypothetical protein LW750_04770 [Bacteroidetes bacterium]|nr:hypothetical protein [Bacteroidota bacterium]
MSRFRHLLGCYGQALKKCWGTAPNYDLISEGNSTHLIWDNFNKYKNARLDQIKINNAVIPGKFVSREQAAPRQFIARLAISMILVLSLPLFIMWILKPANKAVSLLPLELVEWAGLMEVVSRLQVKYVYLFSQYECDTNAMVLWLRKMGVTVNKIPSPNLLVIHSKNLVTDELTLSSPYQLDELQSDTIRASYRKLNYWLPEQFHLYYNSYNRRKRVETGTVGYYSHGSWIRKKTGLTDTGVGDVEAEQQLITLIGELLQEGKLDRVTIFLHPKEKKLPAEELTSHYRSVFGEGRFTFAPLNIPSAQLFDTVDIGVGAISTILFERLFLGCKTIFYPPGIADFPVENSTFRHICAFNKLELAELLQTMKQENTGNTLHRLDLLKYSIYHWKPELSYERKD